MQFSSAVGLGRARVSGTRTQCGAKSREGSFLSTAVPLARSVVPLDAAAEQVSQRSRLLGRSKRRQSGAKTRSVLGGHDSFVQTPSRRQPGPILSRKRSCESWCLWLPHRKPLLPRFWHCALAYRSEQNPQTVITLQASWCITERLRRSLDWPAFDRRIRP